MNKYLIDSSAWIHYFLGNATGSKVKEIVEHDSNIIFTSALTISEIIIKLKKFDLDYQKSYETIRRISAILPIDDELAFKAGILYSKKRSNIPDIGIVDVIIQTHAREENLIVVTSDEKHFKDEKNTVIL